MSEFNIKSSTIEKGLELAKEFLGKLISPTVEETGLLIADNIKFLRFKNQVNILLKAKAYTEKKGLSLKEIPIKILVPLLENSSLEENELLQDKWAKMIANMADSENNLQNQIFPYILGQISIEEFDCLKELLEEEANYQHKSAEWMVIKGRKAPHALTSEERELKKLVESVEQEGFFIGMEEFEKANLMRLGLIREMPPKIYIEEFKTGGEPTYLDSSPEKWHRLKAEYDPENNFYGVRITELGEKFLKVCEEKER